MYSFQKQIILLFISFITTISFGQTNSAKYTSLIKKADTYYRVKITKLLLQTYSQAFKLIKWNVPADDRYNAACSWALAQVPDSTLFESDKVISLQKSCAALDKLATQMQLNKIIKIEFRGLADNTVDENINQKISEGRQNPLQII